MLFYFDQVFNLKSFNPQTLIGYGDKRLLDAHPRFGAIIRVQQPDLAAAGACRQYHPLGDTEAHFARCQVGDQHGQSADQLFRAVSRFNAGKYLALAKFAEA